MRRTAVAAITAALVLVGVSLPTAATADTIVATWPLSGFGGSVVVAPDGERVYVAVNDGPGDRIVVLDASDGSEITSYTGPQWTAYAFGLALSADGSRLYAVSEDTDQLFVFNTSTGATLQTVATGNQPGEVRLGADGRIYVLDRGAGGRLDIFDGTTLALETSVAFASADPFSFVLSPDSSTAYVSNFSGSVTVVDTVAATVVTEVGVGTTARGIAISPDGSRVAVGTHSDNNLVVIDTTTLIPTTLPMSGAYAPLFTADGSELVVARFSAQAVDILDPAALTLIESITAIGGNPRQIVESPSGDRFYVSSSNGVVTVIARDTAPVFVTPAGALTAATAGTPYTTSVAATGFPTPSYSVSAGALPAGIVLDAATGSLSGTPTSAGSSSFSITATNSAGTATRAFTIAVASTAATPELAATGPSATPMLLLASGLLAAGAVLLLRRRRATPAT